MLGVFAKIPDREPAKTRLQTALDAKQAERFQLASLADVVETAARTVPTPWLFLSHGADDRGRIGALLTAHGFDSALWPRVRLAPQHGADLGERMAHAFEAMQAELPADSPPGLVLVGSDSPTVTPAHLRRALAALVDADVVFGPAEDGGYWCAGVRQPIPDLFAGIPWSTPRTLDATLARCRALGLQVALVDAWSDVDRPEDLDRVVAQVAVLRRDGDALTARHVERWLRSERRLGQDAASPEAGP